MSDVATRLRTIRTEVNAMYWERGEAVTAILLGVLAKQHVFVLGPPGTGKSQLAREVLGRITGAAYFEALLSKSRPDQALLGPYDLPLLRDRGEFRRRRQGSLLTAHFAFLDEIGKMSPTTGHDMLAALNERVRHEVDETGSVHPIPLRTAVTASNELPSGESEDAAALWDRLLVRVVVDYIAAPGDFAALLGSAVLRPGTPGRTTVTLTALAQLVDEVVPSVPIPADVIDAVLEVRAALAGLGLRVSDRRWRLSMRLLQAHAVLAGRDVASTEDLPALRFSLWELPEHRKSVERLLLKVANPLHEEALVLSDTIRELVAQIDTRRGESVEKRTGFGSEVLAKLKQIERQTNQLKVRYGKAGQPTDRVKDVLTELESARDQVINFAFEIDPG